MNVPVKICLLLLTMLAPATAYTNINGATGDSTTWITHSGFNVNTFDLLEAIAGAEVHGLNPQSYALSTLQYDVVAYIKGSKQSGSYTHDSNVEDRHKLENDLQSAFERLSRDLGSGVLNPQETQKDLYRLAPEVDTEALVKRLNSGESTVSRLLTEVTPSTNDYLNLVDHMRSLLQDRDSVVTRTKVRLFEGVKSNSHHPSIIQLRARLKETGDLGADTRLGTFFGADVTKALMNVQTRHGISVTGELNESTVNALNATIDDDIQQVAMNLERWRWMPRDLGGRHIMINIPAYNLVMQDGDQRLADMAVVVGSKEHQTPAFTQGAQYIDVAPTWTVPAKITNAELIPKELERPGYLDAQRMDYLRWESGKLVKVPRSEIAPDDFLTKPFPYVLQQRAGKGNALGEVKIVMPNKRAIFMHDSPEKTLFAKTDRAYSHGCIRLSDAFQLSSVLMQLDGKSALETSKLLNKKTTTRVKLKNETPTHISYFTAWVDEDGKLHKRKDVYSHNKQLISGLHAKKTLLSTLKSRSVSVLSAQGDS